MVQNKLPLINSAHGSETRNIINELIKLFNGMGYTYDEALQKAHDVLSEAQQTNNMNKVVQNQLDNLIIESGNANAEVSQARGGLPLLKDRLDRTDVQLAHIATLQGLKTVQEDPDFDNGIIINNKITELASGTIKLPKGKFNFSTPIAHNKPFLTIDGMGIESTVLSYTGDMSKSSYVLDGKSSPGNRSYQMLSNLTIEQPNESRLGIGLETRADADFKIENVKVDHFNINRLVNGSLIFEEKSTTYWDGNIGIKFDVEGGFPANLVSFTNSKIVANKQQAISSNVDINGVSFIRCEIEANGTKDSGLNVIEFTNFNQIGVNQPILFSECWFEGNKGLNEFYINPYNYAGGFALLNCSTISNEVTNNVNVVKGRIIISGGSYMITGVENNVVLSVGVTGQMFTEINSLQDLSNGGVMNVYMNEYRSPLKLRNELQLFSSGSNHHTLSNNGGDLKLDSVSGLIKSDSRLQYKGATLSASNPTTMPNYTIFVDNTDYLLKFKDNAGVIKRIAFL